MKELKKDMTLQECLNQTFSCSCGREHTVALKAAFVGKNALEELPK